MLQTSGCLGERSVETRNKLTYRHLRLPRIPAPRPRLLETPPPMSV
jgi:hypothetical protein